MKANCGQENGRIKADRIGSLPKSSWALVGTMQMLGGKQGGNEQSSPQRNDGQQQRQQPQQQGNHSEPPMDFDDDIPFASNSPFPRHAIHAI